MIEYFAGLATPFAFLFVIVLYRVITGKSKGGQNSRERINENVVTVVGDN